MPSQQSEFAFETQYLADTIALAKLRREQAIRSNEGNTADIAAIKQDMRENATHSVSNLWSSQNYEDFVALSQYSEQIMRKVADYETVASRIAVLERLIESPYFARIDFKFDDEDAFEKIYIGRASLEKDKSYDLRVYDWRSPVASVFYRFGQGDAYYDAPAGRITGEVSLKRQYEIKDGSLDYFFDADVQIMDEFLRKLLSQNTSNKMKAIVETIQKEQDIVIRDMENDLMMVQGVAGSGKTSVALHRAAYLMYQGLTAKLAANNIIIISPNTLFERYIDSVLPELGESNVESVVFEELLTGILRSNRIKTRHQFLESLLTNARYRDIMKSSMEFKTSPQFVELLNRFIADLPKHLIPFEDIYISDTLIVSKETLRERILARVGEKPLGVKLKQLEEYVADIAGEKLKKNLGGRAVRNMVKAEMQRITEPDIEAFYKELFSDEAYFYRLAEGIALPSNIADILAFTQENLRPNCLYYDDAAAVAYLRLKIYGSGEYKHIKQVVIDEAQDYYPLHYEILNLLFPKAKCTILGDINQTLEKRADISLYEQIAAIFKRKRSSLVTMDKSFRCTGEILAYSARFLPQDSGIKSFNREGDAPAAYCAANAAALDDMIVAETELCKEQGYRSIGLICKSERQARLLFERLKTRIGGITLIKNGSMADLSGVFIIPVYMSKGLEFDAVLICDADSESYNSEDDKKLLYIACTRALHRLNLFCEGDKSPLI